MPLLDLTREAFNSAYQSSRITHTDRETLTAAHNQTRGDIVRLKDSEAVREILGRMRVSILNERTDEGKIIKR